MKKLIVPCVAVLLLVGCGEESDKEQGSTSEAQTETEPQLEVIQLDVTSPEDHATVKAKSTVVKGKVDPPSAKVLVDGRSVPVRGGRFKIRVKLSLGENDFALEAAAPGHEDADLTWTVIRKRSAAELAAIRERKRLEKQRKEQEFRAGAKTIDYDQLIKNPDRFTGEKVVYSGQVFQIQEDGFANWLLLSTSCEYDICSDEIYVTYGDMSIDAAQDDQITVYGKVVGGHEYDTQGGGSNYVPHVKAYYIDE